MGDLVARLSMPNHALYICLHFFEPLKKLRTYLWIYCGYLIKIGTLCVINPQSVELFYSDSVAYTLIAIEIYP